MNKPETPSSNSAEGARTACLPGRQRGISILEAVIAIVLLGVGSSMLIVSSKSSTAGNSRSKVFGSAATATKEAMEEIQILPFDSLSRLNNTVIRHSQGPAVTVLATARGVARSDVADMTRLDTSSLRYLILKTRFKDRAGAMVTKNFTTIIFKP